VRAQLAGEILANPDSAMIDAILPDDLIETDGEDAAWPECDRGDAFAGRVGEGGDSLPGRGVPQVGAAVAGRVAVAGGEDAARPERDRLDAAIDGVGKRDGERALGNACRVPACRMAARRAVACLMGACGVVSGQEDAEDDGQRDRGGGAGGDQGCSPPAPARVRLATWPGRAARAGLSRGWGTEAGQEIGWAGAGVRFLGQAAGDDVTQLARQRGEAGRAGQDPGDDRRVGRRLERVAAGGGVGQDRAEGEDVAARGQLLALQLLRGHEVQGPDDGAGSGQGGGARALGDAEVDDAGAVAGHDDVGRQPLGQRRSQLAGSGLIQRPALGDGRGQRRPRNVGRRHPRGIGAGAGVHHQGGVEAADLAGRVHLPREPAAELRVAGELRVHHLDRDLAAAWRGAQVHPAHPALAQPAQQPERPDMTRVAGLQPIHPPAPRNRQESPARGYFRQRSPRQANPQQPNHIVTRPAPGGPRALAAGALAGPVSRSAPT
jgi:hypothetical protein